MTDLRKAAEMALEALEKVTGGHAVVIHKLRQALAQPEQELDYPPECTTPELEVAYAAGWWKALEVQRNKQQALDKKADNARELGLDYEPDMFTNQQNVNMSEERVHKMCICEHIQRCTVFDRCMKNEL